MPAGAIPFPFGECRICQDKATGVHYGVATCEGCKGFFKRSTTKSEKYKCFFGSQCVISPQNRNRCKYCRYRRCLEKGMAIDAVKMGRIPKIDKERALEAVRSGIPVNADEGNQSSSDSGISDTTCQQIAERILPMIPNNDCHLPAFLSPSECGSADPPVRNSGTPCSITSGGSDTFTLQSSSGKRWHYSSEMIRELLNQVMGSPNGKSIHQSVLKKFMRNLSQQQENVDKNLAMQDSGIDSPNSAELQSICKKIVKANYKHDQSLKNKQCNPSANHHIKIETDYTCNQSTPHFSELLSPVHQEQQNTPQFMYSNNVELHSVQAKKRQGDHIDDQPPFKVSTLETLLKNHFLPPSKMEDIDRFLSDAVRHSGVQQADSYEELMDSAVAVTQSASNVVTTDHIQNLASGMPRTNTYIVSSGTSGGPGHLRQHIPECPPGSYAQIPDSFSLSSQVDSAYFTSQHNQPPLSQPSQNTSFTSYGSLDNNYCAVSRPELSVLDEDPLSSPDFSHENMSYDMHSVTPVPYDYNLESKHKTLPSTSTSYGINGFSSHSVTQNDNYQTLNSVNKLFRDNGDQFTVNTIDPPHHSPSPKGRQYYDMSHQSPSKAANIMQSNHNLSSFNSKAEGFNNCTKPLIFDNMGGELSEIAVLPNLPSNDINNAPGIDTILMERTMQRLAEADIKHNQFLRDNNRWMQNFIATKGRNHPPADKSSEGIEKTWNQLIGSVQSVNERIIGFCNDVPGFCRLGEEDRKLMISKAYYDVWMIYAAPFMINGESYLQFPDQEPYTREWMTHFLGKPFVDLMFQFADRLNSCNLTDVEMGILCAIQLTYPDREGVSQREDIKSLHSHYLDVLDYAMSKSHPVNHSRILIDIFKLLPQLTKINQLQEEIIANFAVEGPPGLCKKGEEPPSDSAQGETINDLQNKYREEMNQRKMNGEVKLPEPQSASTRV